MPRGYRHFILAAFGWLALTGQHPSPSSERERAEAHQSIADSLSNNATTNRDLAERAKRPPKRKTCGPRNYQGDDDLCAQWKAADAAADAAWWGQLGTWFSGISSLFVLMALGLAYRANAIARDSAERQLRAYIFLDETLPVGPFTLAVGEPPHGMIHVKNYGQTPAYDVVCQRGSFDGPWPIPDDCEFPADDTGKLLGGTTLAPGAQTSFPVYKEGLPITQAAFDEIISGVSTFYIWGRIKYRDVMNVSRHTNFCLAVDINTVDPALGIKRSHRHNDVN